MTTDRQQTFDGPWVDEDGDRAWFNAADPATMTNVDAMRAALDLDEFAYNAFDNDYALAVDGPHEFFGSADWIQPTDEHDDAGEGKHYEVWCVRAVEPGPVAIARYRQRMERETRFEVTPCPDPTGCAVECRGYCGTRKVTQDDFDPYAVPLCESCGSSACCHAEGERAATQRIAERLQDAMCSASFADVLGDMQVLIDELKSEASA